MDLILQINKINQDIVDNVKNINRGGCGVFAYFLAKRLKELKIKHSICVLDAWGKKSFQDTWGKYLNEVKNNNLNNGRNLSASHFMIKIKETYVDGTGMTYFPDFHVCGKYTIEDMELALKYGSWNSDYNVKQNLKVKRIIDKHLPKSCNNHLKPIVTKIKTIKKQLAYEKTI